MDQVMPPVGVLPGNIEKPMRAMDLHILMMCNAKEREMQEWDAIVAAADPRLKVKDVVTPPRRLRDASEERPVVDRSNARVEFARSSSCRE